MNSCPRSASEHVLPSTSESPTREMGSGVGQHRLGSCSRRSADSTNARPFGYNRLDVPRVPLPEVAEIRGWPGPTDRNDRLLVPVWQENRPLTLLELRCFDINGEMQPQPKARSTPLGSGRTSSPFGEWICCPLSNYVACPGQFSADIDCWPVPTGLALNRVARKHRFCWRAGLVDSA